MRGSKERLTYHPSQRIILPGQVSLELGEGALHQSLHLQPLLLGDPGAQAEALDAPSDPDPGGLDGDIVVNVAADLGGVHVAGVGGVRADAVVLLDDGVEHLGEVLVGVAVPGVDPAVLVVKVHRAGDGLGQGKAGGGLSNEIFSHNEIFFSNEIFSYRGVAGQLVPELLGDVLRHQGVLRLDLGEGGHDASVSGAVGGLKARGELREENTRC